MTPNQYQAVAVSTSRIDCIPGTLVQRPETHPPSTLVLLLRGARTVDSLPLSSSSHDRSNRSSNTNDTIIHIEEFRSGSRVQSIQSILNHLPLNSSLFLLDLTELDFTFSFLFSGSSWSGSCCSTLTESIRLVGSGGQGEEETCQPESGGVESDLLVGLWSKGVCLRAVDLKDDEGEEEG